MRAAGYCDNPENRFVNMGACFVSQGGSCFLDRHILNDGQCEIFKIGSS
jgi:hypothetical protein